MTKKYGFLSRPSRVAEQNPAQLRTQQYGTPRKTPFRNTHLADCALGDCCLFGAATICVGARQSNIAETALYKKFRNGNLIATKSDVFASAIEFAPETEEFLFASGSGGGSLLGGAQSR
jgi:hypothetical protein